MAGTTPETTRLVRVLLALDAAGHDVASVESAVAIAARLQAELLGLFIEDADLLRSAGLPFSQEVCLSTGEFRALGAGDLERTLRSLARRAERSLGEAAERARVPWAFRTVRGHRLQAALEPNGGRYDLRLVVLGRGRPMHAPSPPADGVVYVLDDASDAARKAVTAAGRMVRGEPGEVLLLTTDAAGSAAVADLKGLNAEGVAARVRRLEAGDLVALLSAVGEPRPRALLLPASHPLVADTRALEVLLKRVDFPVIVVS